ncbi:hypothetical protein GCM10009662_18790 [Catellatospora coxensis]|uniref:Uncharacterized protein n=1 Tax=Catellatospora coxensis TaxID=310354 RepID=A0A8J3PA37_9ACTN|nr:hypothetical protein Cco03nite_61370 [Catellatospora coxensis]
MYASALSRTCTVGFTVVHLPPERSRRRLSPWPAAGEGRAPRERPAAADLQPQTKAVNCGYRLNIENAAAPHDRRAVPRGRGRAGSRRTGVARIRRRQASPMKVCTGVDVSAARARCAATIPRRAVNLRDAPDMRGKRACHGPDLTLGQVSRRLAATY